MDRQLDRYRILAELGRGAMGVVYRAEDPLLGRAVALKTINIAAEEPDFADYEARFRQEARAAGGLNHPNIVTIHDIGRAGDVAYMAMELVEGRELRESLGGDRLPASRAIDIAAQIADGLAYAHARGVVHRDIKPANIMVSAAGRVKIMDFGIARMRSAEVKTQTGVLLGSPRYMSPEQVRGERADARADIFALGVVLYEMLTGAAPFGGESVTSIMLNITTVTPPAPSALHADIPPMLDFIVAKALAKDPAARYRDAADLATDLRGCRDDAAAPARPLPAAATVPLGTTTVRAAPSAGERTRRDDMPGAGTVPRPVSRRFDAAAALGALAARTGARIPALDAAQPQAAAPAVMPGSAVRQRRGRPQAAVAPRRDRLLLIAGVTIAALVAAVIALG